MDARRRRHFAAISERDNGLRDYRKTMQNHGKGMETIGTMLAGEVSRRNWQKKLALNQLFLFWDEAVGLAIAAQAQPLVVRGDVLWVRVSDSVWMQQLYFQKLDLLDQLNRRLKQGRLADIRFKVDANLAAADEELEPPASQKPVDPVQEERFEALIDGLEDDEMRQLLRRVWHKNQR